MEQIFTPEKRAEFLETLRETCNVTLAARAAGISRMRAYQVREAEPDFAKLWDAALQEGMDILEHEAHRRAFRGTDKPLTHQGQFTYLYAPRKDKDGEDILDELTGTPKMFPVLDANGDHKVATVKEYSDTLTIFLLKAHRPERFRENTRMELANADGKPFEMTETDAAARLAKLLAAAQSRKDVEDLV